MAFSKKILVFGAHSDDETIGPGGTIALLSQIGYEVYIVTFCWSGRGKWYDTGYSSVELKDKIDELRRKEALEADKILGVKRRLGLAQPTQGIINTRKLYQHVVKIIRDIKPIAIFTHWNEDKHRDHRVVSQITEEARWKAAENVLADLGKPWYTPLLFFYEVTDLFSHPSHIVDITDTFKVKIDAIKQYKSQASVLPNIVNYLEGLARVRGFMINTRYGEAFLLSRLFPVPGLGIPGIEVTKVVEENENV